MDDQLNDIHTWETEEIHTSPTKPRPMFPAPKWTAVLCECSIVTMLLI